MRALVVYESCYGNTHRIADAIGEGLSSSFEVQVGPVAETPPTAVDEVDLLVVGGPTHVHSLPRRSTREAAREAAAKEGSGLAFEQTAADAGLREWLDQIRPAGCAVATFDTRIKAPAAVTGRAGRGIARRLRKAGFPAPIESESFLVDKQSHLLDGEDQRARAWGARVGTAAAAPHHISNEGAHHEAG